MVKFDSRFLAALVKSASVPVSIPVPVPGNFAVVVAAILYETSLQEGMQSSSPKKSLKQTQYCYDFKFTEGKNCSLTLDIKDALHLFCSTQ